MAIATLNSSVDVPDNLLYKSVASNRIAGFNEMESIAEVIVEFASETNQPFQERRSDDSNDEQFIKKGNSLKFAQSCTIESFISSTRVFLQRRIEVPSQYACKFIEEITPPPPQSC